MNMSDKYSEQFDLEEEEVKRFKLSMILIIILSIIMIFAGCYVFISVYKALGVI